MKTELKTILGKTTGLITNRHFICQPGWFFVTVWSQNIATMMALNPRPVYEQFMQTRIFFAKPLQSTVSHTKPYPWTNLGTRPTLLTTRFGTEQCWPPKLGITTAWSVCACSHLEPLKVNVSCWTNLSCPIYRIWTAQHDLNLQWRKHKHRTMTVTNQYSGRGAIFFRQRLSVHLTGTKQPRRFLFPKQY